MSKGLGQVRPIGLRVAYMKPPLKRLVLVTYFGGCAVYALSQSVFGLVAGFRGAKLLSFAALQTLYSPYWPLLLTYSSNGM